MCFYIQTLNQKVENWYLHVHTESFVYKGQFVSSREFFRLHIEELSPLPTQFVDVATDFLNWDSSFSLTEVTNAQLKQNLGCMEHSLVQETMYFNNSSVQFWHKNCKAKVGTA